MRIDSLNAKEIMLRAALNELEALPRAGETLEARVLAADAVAARLKTAAGLVFTARLGGEVELSPGETVTATVAEVSDGYILLKLEGANEPFSGVRVLLGGGDEIFALPPRDAAPKNPRAEPSVISMDSPEQTQPAPESAYPASAEPTPPDAGRPELSRPEALQNEAPAVPGERIPEDAPLPASPRAEAGDGTLARAAEVLPAVPEAPDSAPAVPPRSEAAAPAPAAFDDNSSAAFADTDAPASPAASAAPTRRDAANITPQNIGADIPPEPASHAPAVQEHTAPPPEALPQAAESATIPDYGAPAPDGGEIMIPEASQYSVPEPRTRIKTASGEAPPTERASAPAERTPPPAEASRASEPRGTSVTARPDSAPIRDIELREPPALVHTHIPLKIRGERRDAELYVRRGGKGGKNRGEPSSGDADMLLSLELPSLGKWEALVTVSGRDMSVRMKTESDGARALLASNTDKLAEILSGAGYRLSRARVVLFGEESAAAAPPRAQPARYVDMSI